MRALLPSLGVVLCMIAVSTPARAACDPAAFPVAVDIGHSPTRPGAISARGRGEYAFNSVLAAQVLSALQKEGFSRSFYVAAPGVEIGLLDRTRVAAARGAALFLSIHHDSVQPQFLEPWRWRGQRLRKTTYAAGFSIFISPKSSFADESLTAATALGAALVRKGLAPSTHHGEPIKGENRVLLDADAGVYAFPELAVLRTAQSPALLFEAGVIVNAAEELALQSPWRQALTTDAIVSSVLALCNVTK